MQGRSPAAQRVRIGWKSEAIALAHSMAGPVLAALAVYLLLLNSVLAEYHFNPTGPIMIGDRWQGERFWNESTHVQRGIGYDGQFFYYLAHDPLLLRTPDPETFLDHPAYRYGRILYPGLAWLAAAGRPDALPWALLGVNLVMALLGTVAAADVLRAVGAPRWAALAYAFSPAILLGLIANLSEPTAFALVAIGLALSLRGRHGGSGIVLAFAALAREASVLVSLGFALHAAGRRAWRQVMAYLVPLLLPVVWHLWVWARLGSLPALDGPSNFGVPFSGATYRVGALLGLWPSLQDLPLPEERLPDLLLIGASVAIIVYGLAVIFHRRDVFAVQVWLQAAAAVGTSAYVWVGVGSYARVLGLLYLFFALTLLTARSAAPRPPGLRPPSRH